MEFSEATLEKLKEFAEGQREELKEITKKLNFWEKETTIRGVKLDQARENFYSFQKKADIIQGSLTISELILEAEKNAK